MNPSAVTLPVGVHAVWVRGALVRLLRCLTGSDRHLDDPAGWLAERTGAETVWRMVGEGRPAPRLVIRRDDDVIEDALGRYRGTVEALWVEWLGERGWERCATHSPFARVVRYRSPAGGAYLWHRAEDAGLSEAALVALSREGFRAADELERSHRKLRRLEELAKVVGGAP